MDDLLEATALHKMSATLGERSGSHFSIETEPVVIIKLLITVYEGTRDDGRWTRSTVSEDKGLGGSQDGSIYSAQMPEVVDESVPVFREEVSVAEEGADQRRPIGQRRYPGYREGVGGEKCC